MIPAASSRSSRLERAQHYLTHYPDSSRTWYWKIQVRILSFFLSAYGDVDRFLSPRSRTPLGVILPDRRRGAFTKSSLEIHACLERIAAANRGLPFP